VTLAEDAARPATWEVSRDRQKRVLARVGSAAELTAWLAQKSDPGLNVMWLRAIDGEGQGLGHELAWIDLPEHVPFDLAWDDRRADTVALRALGAYPDPRFSQAKLRLDGHDLPLEASNAECRYAWAPRRAALPATLPDELTFSVDPGSGPETRTFDRRTAAVNTPPVLGKVEGLTPFLETFEGYAGPQHLQLSSDGRMILRRDPVQGRYLAVRNRVLGQRLVTPFRTGFSVAQYPVLQFRYRALI